MWKTIPLAEKEQRNFCPARQHKETSLNFKVKYFLLLMIPSENEISEFDNSQISYRFYK